MIIQGSALVLIGGSVRIMKSSWMILPMLILFVVNVMVLRGVQI